MTMILTQHNYWPAMGLWLALILPLLLAACAGNRYTVHPNALNTADSITYDSLLVAETAINNARADYQAGLLPDSTKPAFNALVRSYTVARAAWLTYRGAIAANQPPDAYVRQLNTNLTDLSNALRAFSEQGAK